MKTFLEGGYKFKLSQEKFAIVDNEDYIKLNKITWYYDYRKYGGYAKHSDKKNNTSIYMHRIILNSKNDKFVDHINGNTLDNRKINLRICTPQQSVMNRGKQINNLRPADKVERVAGEIVQYKNVKI